MQQEIPPLDGAPPATEVVAPEWLVYVMWAAVAFALVWVVSVIFIQMRRRATNLTSAHQAGVKKDATPDFMKVDQKARDAAMQRGQAYEKELETREAAEAAAAAAKGAKKPPMNMLKTISRHRKLCLLAVHPARRRARCDRALLGAYAQSRTSVDAAMVNQAAREAFGDEGPPSRERRTVWMGAAAVLLLLLGAALGWLSSGGRAGPWSAGCRDGAAGRAGGVIGRLCGGGGSAAAPAAPALPAASAPAASEVTPAVPLLDAAALAGHGTLARRSGRVAGAGRALVAGPGRPRPV